MGLKRLESFLRRHERIAIDTSVFIYQLEAAPRYAALSDLAFSWLEQHGSYGITSTISMTELLVQPYRVSDEQRVDEFYATLSRYPNLHWIAPNLEIADLAARIRAEHRLKTPDALQAATAIFGQAAGMLTNDPIFRRVNAFETAVLDEFL